MLRVPVRSAISYPSSLRSLFRSESLGSSRAGWSRVGVADPPLLVLAEVVIAPPALYLLPLKELARKGISIAAQNAHQLPAGAYTGEISCVARFRLSARRLLVARTSS